MKKRAVISFANQNGNYYQALARLGDSLKGRFEGDFIGYIGEKSIGAPLHSEIPYAFKIHAINCAIQHGYEQILWLDSSVYAIRPIDHLFDIIGEQGYLMQDSGWHIGEWTNDHSLDTFKISRDEAMTMKCYGNAGLLGLDTTNKTAIKFLALWGYYSELFKGDWNNHDNSESNDPRCKGHRHDMSIGSIIANKMGMKFHPFTEILQYAAPDTEPVNDTICLFAQGI